MNKESKSSKYQFYFEKGVSENLEALAALEGVSPKTWLTTLIQTEAKKLPKKKEEQHSSSINDMEDHEFDLTHQPITDEEYITLTSANRSRYVMLEQEVLERVMQIDPEEDIPDSLNGVHHTELTGSRLRKFIFITAQRLNMPIPDLYKKPKKKAVAKKEKKK